MLSYKLNKKYSKEQILELYLNKISFWGNTSWVEQAAKNFFWVSAKDLNILQSAYLASQPKSPTAFSPYRHYEKLNWYLYIYNKNKKNINPKNWDFEWLKLIYDEDIKRNIKNIENFKKFLKNLTWKRIDEENIQICWINKNNLKEISNIDTAWCSIINYDNLLKFLNNLKFDLDDNLVMEYQTWRKDYILSRMLTDNYINFDEYKKALIDSIWFKFKKLKVQIKYPHFVFFVKEYLEKKYWKEFLEKWWFKIYTTIDPEIQDKAQEIVEKWVAQNSKKYQAKNAALISVENKTWRILAYIWWVDYYNKKNWWNVDILTSKLQPWSTFKPLVYSLAIDTKTIWDQTPIFDVKTNFWTKYRRYEPNNFDGKFMWKMTVAKALNHSRNIPAIKMYFMAWWTKKIVEYLDKLWIHTLSKNGDYWPSLWLWTWLVKPLELAQVYTVFANMWEKIDISPIEKIIDSNWFIIEERKKEMKKKKKVLSEKTAYIMNYILSNKTWNRPNSWNKFMMLNWGRIMAAKTWTSTDVSKKKWRKVHPKNLWTIWYTPKVTTVVWVWNTNWKALGLRASWLEWAWPILHSFMDYITKKLPTWKNERDWRKPKNLVKAAISSISWLLASSKTPEKYRVYSYFKNKPLTYDNSFSSITIDSRCNWKVTEFTPEEFKKTAYVVKLNSIDPKRANWNIPVRSWWLKHWFLSSWVITNPSLLKPCEEDMEKINKSNAKIALLLANSTWILVSWNNTIKILYKSELPILRFDVYISWIKIQSIPYFKNRKKWVLTANIYIPEKFTWNQTLKIVWVDEVFKKYADTKEIIIKNEDNIPPKITLIRPKNWIIRIYQNTFANLRLEVFDETAVRATNIYIDWKKLALWLQWNKIVVPINKNYDIPVWNHLIKIEAIDDKFNKSSIKIALIVMPPNWPIPKNSWKNKEEKNEKKNNNIKKEENSIKQSKNSDIIKTNSSTWTSEEVFKH
jgi:membrane peptidoglycan carboxypeptidase